METGDYANISESENRPPPERQNAVKKENVSEVSKILDSVPVLQSSKLEIEYESDIRSSFA